MGTMVGCFAGMGKVVMVETATAPAMAADVSPVVNRMVECMPTPRMHMKPYSPMYGSPGMETPTPPMVKGFMVPMTPSP